MTRRPKRRKYCSECNDQLTKEDIFHVSDGRCTSCATESLRLAKLVSEGKMTAEELAAGVNPEIDENNEWP